jgi:2-iminobutanoate/2-iminopropanoate deaminase
MRRLVALALTSAALCACAARHSDATPEYITPNGPPPATRPFSPAVRVGDMLYLAGQIGTDSTGKVVPGGIQAETRQALTNIRDLLQRNGSSMDRVVRCLVMVADMGEWPAMNEVYATFFPAHFPARSAMGANGLALGARVEIECTAVAG